MMPFIETKLELITSKRYRNGFLRRTSIFTCDECGKTVSKPYAKAACDTSLLSFCDKACRNASQSGSLAEKRRKASFEKYGCHYTQLSSVKQKMLDTRIERYGTVAPVHHHPETHEKFKATMLERHGNESPLPRARSAFREKYGVISPWVLPSVRMKNDLVTAGQKGYRAMAQKGRYKLSKPEIQLGDWLRSIFIDVESQFEIKLEGRKSWLIDYYVRDTDTYVQLDGVFWHGLNKPLEELVSFPRVLSQYNDDRDQDAWFLSRDLRLVRITDLEWNKCYRAKDFGDILKKLGG